MKTITKLLGVLLLSTLFGCPNQGGDDVKDVPDQPKPAALQHDIAGDLNALASGGLQGFIALYPDKEFEYATGEMMQETSNELPDIYERWSNSLAQGNGSANLTLLPGSGSFTVVLDAGWYLEAAGTTQENLLESLEKLYTNGGGSTKDLGTDDSGAQVAVNSFIFNGLSIKYKTSNRTPGANGGALVDYIIASGKQVPAGAGGEQGEAPAPEPTGS